MAPSRTTSTSTCRSRSAFVRTPFPSRLLFLCGFAASIACGSPVALEPTEARLAEQLGAMGCQVELILAHGKISVDSVYAAGRIAEGHMRAEPLSEELFSCLKGLHRLRKLRLDVKGGEADRARLRAITTLQSLRELELFGQDVNDEVMTYVCSLTNLESLTVWDAPIGEQGLARLPDLKALKRLDLSILKQVNRRGMQAIAKLHELEYLRIYCALEEGALSPLTALPKLQTVGIGGPHIKAMLAELENVSTIQRVEIARAEVDAATVEHLRAIKNLQFLKLECCEVTTEALKGLQSLRLHGIECVGIGTEALSELAKGMADGNGNLRVSH